MLPLVTCAPATYASNLIKFFLPPAEANMDCSCLLTHFHSQPS
jgi:hypothetical protein